MHLAPSAKTTTGAKRGKTCNRRQAREKPSTGAKHGKSGEIQV